MPIVVSADLSAALKACRRHFATAAIFSFALNLLHLAAPLYMMQVYDRVISSGSGITLAMLTVVVVMAYAALAGLDRARASVLTAASVRLDRLLAGKIFAAMMSDSVPSSGRHRHALRDLDTCRQFVCGHGMSAAFDLPWIPLYVLIGFALHWSIGLLTLFCAALLVTLAAASEWLVRARSAESQARSHAAYSWAESSARFSQTARAMAMMQGLLRRWLRERGPAVLQHREVVERTALMTALVRFSRLTMQSAVLGLGAWLVIEHLTSPGVIFASSLLLGRALQPVEQLIGQWQSLLTAHAAFVRLNDLLASQPWMTFRVTEAPADFQPRLVVDKVSYAPLGQSRRTLDGVGFTIEPGECFGLIGPSGAGKSTLSRLIAGALAPSSGSVRLGGIDMASRPTRNGHSLIGYMPQEVELFADTVAVNIARFSPASREEIERAARMAGAHDLILQLPQGYDTPVGEGGAALSGGMRQRIALARAVFGSPALVVLDEPSSNLDGAGDAALAACIRELQGNGTSVVLISHRKQTTALMSKFLVLINGRLQSFGSRNDVVRDLSREAVVPMSAAPPAVRRIVAKGGRA